MVQRDDAAVNTRIVYTGEAQADHGICCKIQRCINQFGGNFRHGFFNILHGSIYKDPAWLALWIPVNETTFRLPVTRQVPIRLRYGKTIAPCGVSVDSPQPDRPAGKLGIEVCAIRECLLWPVVLVPAASQQPLSLWQAGFELVQAVDDFSLATGAG